MEIIDKSAGIYKVTPNLIPLNDVNRTRILKVSSEKQRGLKMAPWGPQDTFRRQTRSFPETTQLGKSQQIECKSSYGNPAVFY